MVSVELWFPRQMQAEGIRWPALDEDISVEGLLAGRRSGESQESLKRWLLARRR